jgi:hypothetical protein
MRIQPAFIALPVIAALSACTALRDKRPRVVPPPGPASHAAALPLAPFARMVGGEWRMILPSGAGMFDTWHWGPGRHSLRAMTHGESAAGEPWQEVSVVYWHPSRRKVCRLGIGPFRRSVWEGTITFDGRLATGVFDLYQTSDYRKMGLRWTFDGPDRYHDVLLEDSGAGLKPLAEWDRNRFRTLTPVRPPPADPPPGFPEHLKPLESIQGHTWESTPQAQGDGADGTQLHVQSKVEWIPYADAIYARVIAPAKAGEPVHLLDAYVYHHTGAGTLRCLALSNGGGVFEGDLTILEGGALHVEVKGHRADETLQHVLRCDFENDGTLRQRLWSLDGAKHTLMLDVHHRKLPPAQE